MKNIVKYIVSIMMIALIAWGVWSWHDVVISNSPTNDREPSKYNFFVLLTEQDEETNREDVARIDHITNNSIIFYTYDGELWELRVENPKHWNTEARYIVTFNTHSTSNIYDDSIINVKMLHSLREEG